MCISRAEIKRFGSSPEGKQTITPIFFWSWSSWQRNLRTGIHNSAWYQSLLAKWRPWWKLHIMFPSKVAFQFSTGKIFPVVSSVAYRCSYIVTFSLAIVPFCSYSLLLICSAILNIIKQEQETFSLIFKLLFRTWRRSWEPDFIFFFLQLCQVSS